MVAGQSTTGLAARQRESSITSQLQGRLGNTLVRAALSRYCSGFARSMGHRLFLDAAGLGTAAQDSMDSNVRAQLALQRHRDDSAQPMDHPVVRQIGAHGGRALPDAVRQRMEAAFGHDFSHVRVHIDSQAAQAAKVLNAHAFALGAHVFFGAGEWSPGTAMGDRLLAHELTHVQQADRGELSGAHGGSDPSDRHEVAAYANEDRILARLDLPEPSQPPQQAAQAQRDATSHPGPDDAATIHRYTEGELIIASADRESLENDIEQAAGYGRARVREVLRALRAARRDATSDEALVTVVLQGTIIRRVRPEDLDPLIARAQQRLDRLNQPNHREDDGDAATQDAQTPRDRAPETQQDHGANEQNPGANEQNPGANQQEQQDGADRGSTDPNDHERTRREATGHWHTTSEPDITLVLNQAGAHIEGRYQARERDRDDITSLNPDAMGQMRVNTGTISGDLQSDGERETVFRIEGTPTGGRHGDPFGGTMRVRSGGLLFFSRDDAGNYRFERGDREADSSDQAVDQLDDAGRQDAQQPLSEEQQQDLQDVAERLAQIAEEYAGSLTRPGQLTEVRRMESAVDRAFDEQPTEQRDQVRQDLRQRLARRRVQTGSQTIDALEMLRIMAGRFADETPKTRDYLALERAGTSDTDDPPPFHYRLRFGLVGAEAGAAVGVGVHVGTAEVEEVEPPQTGGSLNDSNATGRWRGRYGMARLSLSAGPGGGANIGTLTTWKYSEPAQQHWTRSDVPGPFRSVGASAGVRGLDSGPVLEAGRLELLGRGEFDPLVFIDLGLSADAVLGASAGAQGAMEGGYLAGDDGPQRRRGSDEGPATRQLEVQISDEDVVGFDTDVSQLNETGRAALRRMCALNLEILRDEHTTVTIDAYASRIASAEYNERLTNWRARNTRSAMRAMVQRGMTTHVALTAHGERAAEEAGVRDGDDSAEWRRVDIRINGTLVLRLRSERTSSRAR